MIQNDLYTKYDLIAIKNFNTKTGEETVESILVVFTLTEAGKRAVETCKQKLHMNDLIDYLFACIARKRPSEKTITWSDLNLDNYEFIIEWNT